MLYICFGFDYELFLGDNYLSFDDILFKPSNKIVEVFNKNKCTATFFADVLCALQMKSDLSFSKEVKSFENQLSNFVYRGMDVQLHIHSNWLTSNISDGQLSISASKYKIHDYDFSKDGKANEIIKESIIYLNKICSSAKPDYRCIAYRAGGFMIQPENVLFESLLKNGICIDSSIVPFMKNGNEKTGYFYNFLKCPKNTPNWFINYKCGYSFKACYSDDSIFEIPLLTYKPNILKMTFCRKTIKLPSLEPRGSYVNLNNQTNSFFSKINSIFKRFFAWRLVSLDTDKASYIYDNILHFYNKNNCRSTDCFISIIGHPKLIWNEERINNIDLLLKLIANSSKNIKIINFQEAHKILNLK